MNTNKSKVKRQEKTEQEAIDELWQKYTKTKDNKYKDKIIIYYAPIVKYVAGRISASLPSNIERGDLIAYGMFGLIDAVEKFQPSRKIKFQTYAVSRIKGAIIDELRAIDWVPRSIRQVGREVEQSYQDLQLKLRRAPSDIEIAEHMGVSMDKLFNIYNKLSSSSMVALEEIKLFNGPSDSGSISMVDVIKDETADEPAKALEDKELKMALTEAIKKLPERERIIISLYYYEALTLKEIGEILGITESRVSQLRTKAAIGLKAALKGRNIH